MQDLVLRMNNYLCQRWIQRKIFVLEKHFAQIKLIAETMVWTMYGFSLFFQAKTPSTSVQLEFYMEATKSKSTLSISK